MTDEERTQCTTAIADYKSIGPVVQLGNLYRLVSPYDREGMAALMYVDDTKDKAVVFVYKMENLCNQTLPRLVLDGLDHAATYTVRELNVKTGSKPSQLDGKSLGGQLLMEAGIEVPLDGDYASRIYVLEKK